MPDNWTGPPYRLEGSTAPERPRHSLREDVLWFMSGFSSGALVVVMVWLNA